MSLLSNLHFLRPLALLLLLALPLFWIAWRHGRHDAGAWRAAIDPHLLPHLMERVDGGPGRAGVVFGALMWALACIALAGPAWEREPMPLYRNQAARVLALELSPTMLTQDEKPSRLARARYKINDILSRSRDYQTALIGYGGDAFVAAPLTDDVDTVRNLVDALDPTTMPVPGNATASAIARASDLIAQAGLHSGEIILLADSAEPAAVAAARKARSLGYTVSVLGVGTAAGAPVPLGSGGFLQDANGNLVVARLDAASLRAVAEAGGGRYAGLAADAQDLDSLLVDHTEGADHAGNAGSTADASGHSARWRDRGPWLLLLLLPLALCGFRRGWLMVFALAFVAPPQTAQAASWRDLWQRPDQQAAAALAQGDAKHAAEVAPTPQWRGSAAYRAGDYKAAADEYAQTEDADGAYNRGNALAQMGRYEDAMGAYDAALKLAPDMADASANRDVVKNLLERQNEKQQEKNQQQNQQSGQKDQQNQQGQPQDQKSSDPEQGGQDKQEQADQQQGESKDSPSEQNKDAPAQSGDDKNPQNAQKPSTGDDAKPDSEPSLAQAPDAEQQKALSQSIDQALADQKAEGGKDKAEAALGREDEATREKKQALEHLLQRVPDDPGGLLRRKFQLEYQRRQSGGGQGE